MDTKPQTKKSNNKYVWVCDYCSKKFDSKNECDKHELDCKKNIKSDELVLRLKKSSLKKIYSPIIIFGLAYLLTFFVVNSYAKSNGLPKIGIANPQKWFMPMPTPTSTPTIAPMINNPFGLSQDTLVFCIGLGDGSKNSMTLKQCEDYYKLAKQPVDYMVNCEQKAECGGKSVYMKLSECKNSVCCQINNNYWKEYPSIEECEKARATAIKTTTKTNSVKPQNNPTDIGEWGKAVQVDEHTWTMKIGEDSKMATSGEILQALNDYRSKSGSQILTMDPKLSSYAQTRADYFFSIGNLDGHKGFNNFLENEDGYNKLGYSWLGENASIGYRLNGVHLIEWIYAGDEPHDRNQLDSKWDHVGIGIKGTATALIFGTGKR